MQNSNGIVPHDCRDIIGGKDYDASVALKLCQDLIGEALFPGVSRVIVFSRRKTASCEVS
jgi:hypothetical protein